MTVAAVAAIVLTSLTGCTPATYVWGYVGEGSDLRFAFCDSSTVTMARLSVSERPVSQLVEVDSAVWSGPRIVLPEGAIFSSTALPDGWQTTNDLDLSGAWDRIDIDLYDGDKYVDSAIFTSDDVEADAWALSPRPGFFAGTTRCRSPFDKEFVRQPSTFETGTASALAEAKPLAMSEDDFWALLASVDRGTDNFSQGLMNELAPLSLEEVTAFHAQLMLQYFVLDTALVWKESERQRRADFEYETTPNSNQFFVDFRTQIILAGPAAVKATLNGEAYPTAWSAIQWPGLSGAAGAVLLDRQQGSIRIPVPLSPGMGLNTEGW